MAVFVTVFLFVGVVAIGGSWLSMQSRFDEATRVLAGGFGMVSWWIWAYYALDVASAHRAVSHSYRPLAFLGAAAGVIMLLFTISAAFGMLGDTAGSSMEDMSGGDFR